MKNSQTTSGGSGRSFFSSWTAPQNPLITLLKRRRESKTSAQTTEKQAGGSFKTSTETRQQQQQNAHNPFVQTSFKITSSSSSTTSTPRKSNGTSLQNANEFLLKRDNTNGFQPMKIEEYEPGHSSIALKEGILEPADYNPPICKPGELCRYSESKESKNFRIRKKTETANGSRLGFFGIPKIASRQTQAGNDNDRFGDGGGDDDAGGEVLMRKKVGQKEDARAVYRSVQKGGSIPEEGLRNLIDTRLVKTLPAPPPTTTTTLVMKKSLTGLPNGTSGDLERIFEQEASNRMGRKKTREELMEEMRTRKMTMDRILTTEKLKKLEEEKKSNEARRHNDNFLPVEKSPVKLNRYDDDTVEGRSRNSDLRKSKFTAVAIYNFKAKNDRELALRKGDTVHVLKQIDRNWFEGELNGRVGMFPITYVKINLPLSQTRRDPTLRGKVLYDFNANAPPELSLYKGEKVTVVGAIDDNWVEGRSRNGEGIFPLSYVKILDDVDDDDDDDRGGASRSSSQYGTPLHSRTVTPSFDHRNAYSRLSLRERPRTDLRASSPVGSTVSSYAPTIPSAPLSPFGSQELDTTMRSFGVSDWPSLEASLLDLEKVSITQLMQQQQHQQKPAAGRFGGERNLERAASLQYRNRPQHDSFRQQQQQQQQQLRQHLLQLEREAEQQRKTQMRHSQLDRFQERSRDSPRGDLLSQSAHPDLFAGSYLSRNSQASRSMNITRSATNSGLSERTSSITNSNNNYNQSSPYHRYPSFISKDAVAVDNEVVVKEMIAKQSEAVTREFLSRHGSNLSLARSVTPLARHSLPVAKDSARVATLQQRPVSRQPIGSSSGYFSSHTTLVGAVGTPTASIGGLDGEVFAFKEIKLKPRLPADYSRACYTVETRTSLPGARGDTPTSPIGRESPSPFATLGRGREVSPMKSYEWHKVSHDFRPSRADEIRLTTGDMVQVVEKCRDGWWLGISQTTGKMGLFPGSYVTPS